MPQKSSHHDHIIWAYACLAALAYYLVKFLTPQIVGTLLNGGQVPLLNWICGVSQLQTLDFYIGECEKNFLGPFAALIAGGCFAAVCLKFLTKAPLRTFYLSVFAFLFLTKFERILNPPYGGDAITAVFAETIWLARHKMDYLGLYHQPTYVEGGPRVYLVNIYPGFLALQMLILRSAKIFLAINHLLAFAMGAGVVTMFRDIASRVFKPRIALLASLAVLLMPIFQSQVEMINMEIPVLFMTFTSAWFLTRKKFPAAALSAMLAGLVKGSGVISTAAVFVVGLIIFMTSTQEKERRQALGWGGAALVFGLGLVFLTNQVHNQQTVIGFIKFLDGVILGHTIFYVYLIALVIVTAFLFIRWSRAGCRMAAVRDLINRYYPALVIFVFAGMWMALYLNFTVMLARYKLLAYPFVLFCCVCALKIVAQKEKLLIVALSVIIVLALCSAYGWLETEEGNFHYIQIERSLEYRRVLERDMRLAREIEKKYSDQTIAAPPVLAQILALPELGYVSKPLNVMIYAMPCRYCGIANFTELSEVDIPHTVWVGYRDGISDDMRPFFEYPVDPRDKVLGEIEYGDKKAFIFKGGLAIEKVRRVFLLAGRRRHFGHPPEKSKQRERP